MNLLLLFFKVFILFMVSLVDFFNFIINRGELYLYKMVILEVFIVSQRSLSEDAWGSEVC